MEEKIKKIINYPWSLLCMRFFALLLLAFMICWVFSEWEYAYAIMFNVPLFYMFNPNFYVSKKITVLVLPILFNIALWYSNHKSYIFIRGVLYAELYKTIAIMFVSYFGMTASILFYIPEAFLSAKISTVYFIYLLYMISRTRKDKYKEIFKSSNEYGIWIKNKSMIFLIYIGVIILVSTENVVEDIFPPRMAEVRNYQIEHGLSSSINNIDLSPNGESFIATFQSGKDKQIIGHFDLENGKIIKEIEIEKSARSFFTPDGKALIIPKYDVEKNNVDKFEIRDIETGEKIKKLTDPRLLFKNVDHEKMYMNEIHFSPDGQYFATEGGEIELWNFYSGELVALYDVGSRIDRLCWLSNRGYIVIYMPKVKQGSSAEEEKTKMEKNVYWDEITVDNNLIRNQKEEMTHDLRLKTLDLTELNLLSKKGLRDKYAAIVISGKPREGVWYYKGYVDVWDVDGDKKVFSYQSNYRVLNVEFHPDGESIVIFEQLRNKRTRISYWNIEMNRREKILLVPELENMTNIRLIRDGKNAVQFRNSINLINLD